MEQLKTVDLKDAFNILKQSLTSRPGLISSFTLTFVMKIIQSLVYPCEQQPCCTLINLKATLLHPNQPQSNTVATLMRNFR